MRKSIIVLLALICSVSVFAQERDYTVLKGLSVGIGVPFECRDLPGMGTTLNVGYDCAYPVSDRLAMGFYITGGGGFWGEYRKYSDVDHLHVTFRLTAGLMMRIGDVAGRPYLLGVVPCTGFGLYDADMVLPVEVRFGRFLTDRLYVMGELTCHASLAGETACFEPAVRVGYNFGCKTRAGKR